MREVGPRQLLARLLVVLEPVMGPSAGNPFAPWPNGRGMPGRNGFSLAVFLAQKKAIRSPIPGAVDRREGMVPAEIDAVQLRPMGRNGKRIDTELFLLDRKHAPGAENGNAFGPRLALVRQVGGDDPVTLLRRVVLRLVDGHEGDVASHPSTARKKTEPLRNSGPVRGNRRRLSLYFGQCLHP